MNERILDQLITTNEEQNKLLKIFSERIRTLEYQVAVLDARVNLIVGKEDDKN